MVALPTDESGHLLSIVHPDRDYKDFTAIEPGQPLLISIADATVVETYTGNEAQFPVFINEAAYFPTNIAMRLTKKITLPVY